ncbi:MAG TPA: hypothetical protein VIJ93_11205, partial [bacterium]
MAQFTVAVNQSVVQDVFLAAESGFVQVFNGTGNSGSFTASYNIGLKLSGGSLAFSNAGTLNLTNVNVTTRKPLRSRLISSSGGLLKRQKPGMVKRPRSMEGVQRLGNWTA